MSHSSLLLAPQPASTGEPVKAPTACAVRSCLDRLPSNSSADCRQGEQRQRQKLCWHRARHVCIPSQECASALPEKVNLQIVSPRDLQLSSRQSCTTAVRPTSFCCQHCGLTWPSHLLAGPPGKGSASGASSCCCCCCAGCAAADTPVSFACSCFLVRLV